MKKLVLMGLLSLGSATMTATDIIDDTSSPATATTIDGRIEFKAYTSATLYPVPSNESQRTSLYSGNSSYSDNTHDYYQVYFGSGQYTSPYKNGGVSTAAFTIKMSALNKSSGCNYHICRIYGTHLAIWSYTDASTNNLKQIIIATSSGVYKSVNTPTDANNITSKMKYYYGTSQWTLAGAPYAITDATPQCVQIGYGAYQYGPTYSW